MWFQQANLLSSELLLLQPQAKTFVKSGQAVSRSIVRTDPAIRVVFIIVSQSPVSTNIGSCGKNTRGDASILCLRHH